MVRFIPVVILLLMVRHIRSDETRNLTKDSKRKFLDGLLKILRNLRSGKKIELSPTRTPKRIAVPQFSVDLQQPLIIDRNTISANLSRHHIYNDDKKPEERSNVSNPANVSTNINQKFQVLENESKKKILLDLLKTLKGRQNRKKAESIQTEPLEWNSSSADSRDKQSRILLQNVSTVIGLHNPTEEHFSNVIKKSGGRSNVIQPTEILNETSTASHENEARRSFAQARLTFLETLEIAQDEKLNKLGQLEKEFSSVLSQNISHNNAEIKPAKKYSLNEVPNAETRGATNNVQLTDENSSRNSDLGAPTAHKFSVVEKPSYSTADVSSKILKKDSLIIRAHSVHGNRNEFGRLLDTGVTDKNVTKSGTIFPLQIRTFTPWGHAKNQLSLSPAKFANETAHFESMKSKLEEFEKVKKADSSPNETLVTSYHNRRRNALRLQRMQQGIVFSHSGNKTNPIAIQNLHHKSKEALAFQYPSDFMAKSGLQQNLRNQEDAAPRIGQNVREKSQENEQLLSSTAVMRDATGKIQKVAVPTFSNNRKIDKNILTDHERVKGLRQRLIYHENTMDGIDKINLEKNKENRSLSPFKGLIREAPNEFLHDALPLITNKYQFNHLAAPHPVKDSGFRLSSFNRKNKAFQVGQKNQISNKEKQLQQSSGFTGLTQGRPNMQTIKFPTGSNKLGFNNKTGKSLPKTYSSLHKSSYNNESNIPGGMKNLSEKNKGKQQPHLSGGLIDQVQNKLSENYAVNLISNKYNHNNMTPVQTPQTNSRLQQSSPDYENTSSGKRLTEALQNAQSIFLEKVKEILAGQQKSKEVSDNNHFRGTRNKNVGNKGKEDNEIKSSAYDMEGLTTTKSTPRPEINKNPGIMPLSSTNPVIPLSGNVASPVMQQASLGHNAPIQVETPETPGSSFPVEAPITGNQLSYAQQQDAHLEERIASDQERAFQASQNGATSSVNGAVLPYRTPQIHSLYALGSHFYLPNGRFRYPNVDDLNEYRGGMGRYQLSHNTGDDTDDEPLRGSHFHHYTHDDEDDESEEDDDDDDDFDKWKKKSHIRQPHNLRGKKLQKSLSAYLLKNAKVPIISRSSAMKQNYPKSRLPIILKKYS